MLKNKKRHELLTIHASLHDKIPSLSVTVFKRSVNFSITLIFGVSTISVFRFSNFIYKNDYIFQICVILSITISIFIKCYTEFQNTNAQQDYLVDVIMTWIQKELESYLDTQLNIPVGEEISFLYDDTITVKVLNEKNTEEDDN